MASKLLLILNVNAPPEFKGLIKQGDAVRSELNEISCTVTNIGNETFPGGKVTNAKLNFGSPPGFFTDWTNSKWECPILKPNETQQLFKEHIAPLVEGLAWMHITISANDNQPIEYYQAKDDPLLGSPEWGNGFCVVNRELLLIIANIASLKEPGPISHS